MRVLITDFLAESDFEREVLPGVEVDALLSLIGHPPTPTDLVRVLGERPAEVLITWYEMFFDPTTLAALSRAGVVGIVRAGVGFDNIDLVGARAAGITVCNVPDYGTDEVADHAMALLSWCLRCIRAAPPTAVPQLYGGMRPVLPLSSGCRNAPWACSALVVLDRRPPGERKASASTYAGTIPTCRVDRIRSHEQPAWRTCPLSCRTAMRSASIAHSTMRRAICSMQRLWHCSRGMPWW